VAPAASVPLDGRDDRLGERGGDLVEAGFVAERSQAVDRLVDERGERLLDGRATQRAQRAEVVADRGDVGLRGLGDLATCRTCSSSCLTTLRVPDKLNR